MRLFGQLNGAQPKPNFLKDTRGAVVIESLIALTMLSLVGTAMVSFWDAYQTKSRLQKATYTVSDLISRQRGTTLTRGFLDGMKLTADFAMQDAQQTTLRVSQVSRASGTPTDPNGLVVDWSYSPCNRAPALGDATLGTVKARLPMIDLGASLVVVELVVEHDAGMPSINFSKMSFAAFIASLPRFEQRYALAGTSAAVCR